MRFEGRGDPAIRATHAKTLEVTTATRITERATCVVAVAASAQPPGPMAGPVRITISAGPTSFVLHARANSDWDPDGPAVIRRSPLRLPTTFATHASAAADDLPRDLVRALREPESRVRVDVEPVAGPACVVLFNLGAAPGAADRRLEAELAAADLVVTEDERAARRLRTRATAGPVTVSGRTLVVACDDLPGASVTGALRNVEVETVGLPPALAAAAASPSRGPLLLVPPGADLRTFVRSAPADTRIVLTLPADRAPSLLALAGQLRGTAGAVLVQDATPPQRITAITAADIPTGTERVHVCLDASDAPEALEPTVRAAVEVLLADGVPTRTAARTLAAMTGWDRRRAYDTILHWTT